MANRLTQAVSGVQEWFNDRAPSFGPFYAKHMTQYYAPKNFNIWYIFGVLSMVVLINQIVTGIFLTMFFKPSAAEAFASVEYIMRDVEWGWLIRYMHSTGASAFFVVVYLLSKMIIEKKITPASPSEPLQITTAMPVVIAMAMPLMSPMRTSFDARRSQELAPISRRAMPSTYLARVSNALRWPKPTACTKAELPAQSCVGLPGR